MIVTVILFCAFVGLVALGGSLTFVPWGLPVMLCAVFVATGAITEYWYWIREGNARINRINAQAERDRVTAPLETWRGVLQDLYKLSPDQQKLITMYRATIGIIANPGKPKYTLTVDRYTTDDWDAVAEWQTKDTPDKLPAIGWWSENTNGQKLARAIVHHMVNCGYAVEPVGNQPAKWLDRRAGLESIGLEVEE